MVRRIAVTTLAGFLLARITDDAAAARQVQALAAAGVIAHLSDSGTGAPLGDLLVFDPARVLAECEAKGQIVNRYQYAVNSFDAYPNEANRMTVSAMTDVLRLLALPYAGHEDFREEWKS
jgi:hypothetical protein